MARNRKRAKERRSRRPADQAGRPGVATARQERERVLNEPSPVEELEDVPESIRHAAPDVELADAQLALGRPELADGEAPVDESELTQEALDTSPPGRRGGEAGPGSAVAERPSSGNRLITFLQGSWRELQRVQWPDRRQVMQATGVVIGFVIVAGVFLGVADAVANKLVNLILQ